MSKRKDRTNTIYYKIAKIICSKYEVEEDTKYIAMFLDMMVFQIFESIILLTIGYLFGILMETALVMAFFVIARVGHKGQHANTRKMCLIYSTLLIIGVSYISSQFGIVTAPILGYIAGILLRKRKIQ